MYPSPMQQMVMNECFHAINLTDISETSKRRIAYPAGPGYQSISVLYFTNHQIADRDRDG